MNAVIQEIRRQRRELLRRMKEPKALYLGPEEYREFRDGLSPHAVHFFHSTLLSAEPPVERYEGMEVFERIKPGVHVCEASP